MEALTGAIAITPKAGNVKAASNEKGRSKAPALEVIVAIASVRGRHLLFDLTLQPDGRRGKLAVVGLEQPRIETAIVLDRAQAGRGDAQAH